MTFDAKSVREDWDLAADAYADGQANGRDFYRYAFFGPAQIELVGKVQGARLLDVGCGSGYFSRAMAERGAEVIGIDLSPRMIDHARDAGDPIEYAVVDAEHLDSHFAPCSFDVATACMSLQDMPNPQRALAAIHTVLRPGGRLVFSIEHPVANPPFREWARDALGGKMYLCIDRYFDRGPVPYTWKRWAYEFTTSALHVTLEDWFTWILDAGFTLRGFREPRPSHETVYAHPELSDAARVPYFAMFDLVR
ncbi:MAG: class I SAM-dependent methyltransferase [Myxococcota bacterium]|nr:class I SAM-dependent methyltransferase [Myxococcota bacterium]